MHTSALHLAVASANFSIGLVLPGMLMKRGSDWGEDVSIWIHVPTLRIGARSAARAADYTNGS